MKKKPIHVSFNQKGLHVFFDEVTASFHCHNCADSKKHTNIYQGTHCERCPEYIPSKPLGEDEYKEMIDGTNKSSRKT